MKDRFYAFTAAIAFVIFIFLLLGAAQRAHGAIIDPHVTSPFYITVVAEKGDTAYSIANLFTPRGQLAMPVATAFVVFNNLKYNKKGSPVVHAGRLYAFPTKLSRDRMQELALSLNTASRDWHREHHARMHGVASKSQMMGAHAHHGGPSALEKTDSVKMLTREGSVENISAPQTKAGGDAINPVLAFLLIALTIAAIIFAARSDYKKYAAKPDDALASPAQPVKEPSETNVQLPTPDEKKGETSGVSESKVILQSVAKPEVAPTPEEKPPVQVATATNAPSPTPDEKKGGTASGASESRALPPEYKDQKEPYSDPAALTGISPEQQMLNLIWMRPVDGVAALLDFDTVPIAVDRPGGKYEVKWIKFGNLRKSLEVHPEWKGEKLYDLIVGQQTAVAIAVRAGDSFPPPQP